MYIIEQNSGTSPDEKIEMKKFYRKMIGKNLAFYIFVFVV